MKKECKHDWKKEMVVKRPNWLFRLFGAKKKKVWAGEGYLVCSKCGARGLYLGGDNIFVQGGETK